LDLPKDYTTFSPASVELSLISVTRPRSEVRKGGTVRSDAIFGFSFWIATPNMTDVSELPEKIDKYEILGVAGRGAMGVVYHGHDPFSDREVAIKTTQKLSDDGTEYAVARKMLFTEANAASALNHGTIIQVLDVGEFEGEPYVVMEYVPEASTLKDYCRADRLLPISRVASIIYACARALDHAHQQGVIHRDIKASNILLTADDQAKIGDFGIATIASRETTVILGAVGSPRYMSPEQFMEKPLTSSTDLYSLGVVLFEILTGHPVFGSRTFVELAREVITVVPTAVHELRDAVSQALSDVVARAISKRPEDRFESGAQFADALAAIFPELDHAGSKITIEHKLQLARELSFFNSFSDAQLREFVEACEWQCVAPGARIIREGNMERSCYVVVAGEVAIMKGAQQISAVGRANCFGEMGFLSRSGRTATARARGEATLLVAQADTLTTLSEDVQKRFNQCLIDTLVERLASTTERLSKFLAHASS
jgi:serine/threonine protein kinase